MASVQVLQQDISSVFFFFFFSRYFFHRADIMLIVKIYFCFKKIYKKTCLSYSNSVCIMASVQVLQQDISSLFFKHPFNIFISGPSGSGKTEFVKK